MQTLSLVSLTFRETKSFFPEPEKPERYDMDPCPFVRLLVESLSLKLPIASKSPGSGIHPSSTTPCFCKIRLKNFSTQTALLPLADSSAPSAAASSAIFLINPELLRSIAGKPISLCVSVYMGRMGPACGFRSNKLLGRVRTTVELGAEAEGHTCELQNGWFGIGKEGKPSAQLHLVVRSEPDPRFVFRFGGEPACSPVVLQMQRNIWQPVFSCKFSANRYSISCNKTRGWLNSFGSERKRPGRERKGWMIMIYDLSGSPVAAASMITPFVPSPAPGSDRVSRSNPGAWLILQADGISVSSWKPWARLECWRERGPIDDALGYKLELMTDAGSNNILPITESTISARKGGQFCIDRSMVGDFVPGTWPWGRGFVMSSTVEGEWAVSKPTVEVGVQHKAHAAVFIALSAAINLSMDACRLFSQKLWKAICHDQ